MAVFVDMDEVLSDFSGAAMGLHGFSWEDFEPNGRLAHRLGLWGIEQAMEMTPEQLWKPINAAGAAFWESLAPLPWMKELVQVLEPFDWFIASSPSLSNGSSLHSRIGKHCWLEKHLPDMVERAYINRNKSVFANHRSVLIDDRPDNVAEFIACGGRAILFPSYCNRLYRHRKDPVEYVAKQLRRMSCL